MLRLEYRDVTMRFADAGGRASVTAIEGVSFSVADGEVVALIGPSGCGKSTLLNIGSGLYAPTRRARRSSTASRSKDPIATSPSCCKRTCCCRGGPIAENVMLGVEIQGLDKARMRAHARVTLLRGFNLADFSDHYPHQLSGGMRQRVALARTLAVDPSVLLLDEPFSAVDAQTRIVAAARLAQTLKRAGKTALLITHDLLEAVILSDRVLVMSARPGRIVDEIAIEIGRPRRSAAPPPGQQDRGLHGAPDGPARDRAIRRLSRERCRSA